MKIQSILAAALALATCALPALADPPAGTGTWTPQLTDNFDTLDYSVWHNGFPAFDGGYHDSPYRFEGYMPDADPYASPPTLNTGKNVTVSGGNLLIASRRETNRGGGPYTTGFLNTATRKAYLYGFFEIRAKFQSSPGYDPDFFLFTNTGAWPPEIDIAEIPGRGNGNEAQFNVHWRTDGLTTGFGDDNSAPFSVPTDPNNFHTYAALWDPQKVIFYMDGKEMGRVVGHSPNVPMMMNLAAELQKDSGGFYGDPANGTFPSTQTVDYVKVWQHDGGASVPQLDETDITNTSGGTIAARGDNPPNEVKANAFDNYISSKWLDFGVTSDHSSWISYTLPAGQKATVNRVAITASNSSHERDPKNVTLYGIKDDNTWFKIGSATSLTYYSFQRRVVDFPNTTPYKGYVLGIDAVANATTANSVQLAELEFIRLGAEPGTPINGTIYEIEQASSTGTGTGSVLDVSNSGTTDGTVVHTYSRNNSTAQRWKLEAQTDGTWELIPQIYGASTERLDVQNGGGSGALVQLYHDLTNGPQHWKFTRNTDGTYAIVTSYNASLLLTANSTQCTVTTSGGANQKWLLNPK